MARYGFYTQRDAVQGCHPFLLMVYSGSPVETSVGHGLHQQRCFDTVLSFPVGSRMLWRRFNF